MNKNLPQSVDEMQDIIDIEGIIRSSVPDLVFKLVLGILMALAVLGVIFLIKKAVNKRRNREKFLPADAKALSALDKLKRTHYILNKEWNFFYFSLDEILRHYLSEAFDIDVLDKTYEELKTVVAKLSLIHNGKFNEAITGFWHRAQFIKFAKQSSEESVARRDLDFVSQFVILTRQQMQLKEKNHE